MKAFQGLITYLRTESTQVSQVAQDQATVFIRDKFGPEYQGEIVPGNSRLEPGHEAIRPTNVSVVPQDLWSLLQKKERG